MVHTLCMVFNSSFTLRNPIIKNLQQICMQLNHTDMKWKRDLSVIHFRQCFMILNELDKTDYHLWNFSSFRSFWIRWSIQLYRTRYLYRNLPKYPNKSRLFEIFSFITIWSCLWTTEFILKLIDRPRNDHDVGKNRPLMIVRLAYGCFFCFGWNQEQLYYGKSIVLTIIYYFQKFISHVFLNFQSDIKPEAAGKISGYFFFNVFHFEKVPYLIKTKA